MYGLKMPHRRGCITLSILQVFVESHSTIWLSIHHFKVEGENSGEIWLIDESHCEVCLSISPLKPSSSRRRFDTNRLIVFSKIAQIKTTYPGH